MRTKCSEVERTHWLGRGLSVMYASIDRWQLPVSLSHHPVLLCAGSPAITAPVCHVRDAQNGILTHFPSFVSPPQFEIWNLAHFQPSLSPGLPVPPSANAALHYPGFIRLFHTSARLSKETFMHVFTLRTTHSITVSNHPIDAGLDLFLQKVVIETFFFCSCWLEEDSEISETVLFLMRASLQPACWPGCGWAWLWTELLIAWPASFFSFVFVASLPLHCHWDVKAPKYCGWLSFFLYTHKGINSFILFFAGGTTMARFLLNMRLFLVLCGLFLLSSPSARAEPEPQDEEEEESSCQGAFDLYFVLDK